MKDHLSQRLFFISQVSFFASIVYNQLSLRKCLYRWDSCESTLSYHFALLWGYNDIKLISVIIRAFYRFSASQFRVCKTEGFRNLHVIYGKEVTAELKTN